MSSKVILGKGEGRGEESIHTRVEGKVEGGKGTRSLPLKQK